MIYPYENIDNIYSMIKRSVKLYPNRPALGYITVET